MTTQVVYSDIPTNLTVHPVKEDLVLLTNENSVKRSIRNLLLTDPFERPFSPKLGSGIRATLFENVGIETELVLTDKIRETIINYEPRANLINVSVKALSDDNSYTATIVFSLINSITPVTLDLILRRVR